MLIGPAPRLEAAARLRDQPAGQRSSPTSRTISPPYAVWSGGTGPPPPKQPQSMLSPRAAAETTPAMKTSQQPRARDAAGRVAEAGEQQQAEGDLDERQAPADQRLQPVGNNSYARTAATEPAGRPP